MLITQDQKQDLNDAENVRPCAYSKLVVVLGMHRSGTSVITKALECVGVELGNNLMEAAIGDNDLGFFEDLEIVNFNDELLAECNKKWYTTETIQVYDVENLIRRGFLIRAVEMIRRKLMNKKCFGYKDPRSAKLLPFWSKVYETAKFDTYFILALRNPLNVVRSLQKRDGIECGHAYYLWADYITSSLTFLKNKKFIAIDYDHILDNPREVISQISEFLHMQINLGALDIYEQQIIKKSLRHWSFIDSDLALDNGVPHLVHDIYSITKNLGSHSHSADIIDMKVLEGLRSEIEQDNQFLKLADAQYTKLTEKEKELSLLRGVTKAHEEAIKWAQDLEVELKSTQENFVGVTKAHEEAIKWAQDLEVELKSTQENFAGVTKAHEEAIKWAQDLEVELKSTQENFVGVTKAHKEAIKWAQDLEVELKSTQENFAGVTKAHEEAIKWAQDLEVELKSTQENFVGVTKAHEEAIKWAQDLEVELKSTQENFAGVTKAHEEAIKWAQDLEVELKSTQENFAGVTKAHEEAIKWAQDLEVELKSTQENFAGVTKAHEEAIKWAQDLEVELKSTQENFAGVTKAHEEAIKWAQDLEVELKSTQENFVGVTKAHEEAIKWAQDLEVELKSTQENFAGVTKAHEEAIKWAQDLEVELKSTQENFVKQDLKFFTLESNLSFAEKRIQALLSSNSWKFTYPLRELARWRSTPKIQQKKYFDLLIKELKFVYLSFIKSEDVRLAHKRILEKILPSFLQESSKSIQFDQIVELKNNETNQRDNHFLIQDTLYFEEINFTQIVCIDQPKISIIIPIFGNIKFTMDCLKSIEVNSAGCPNFEIIVVDDCSPDVSVEILNKFVKGIKLVKNKVNQGFIRSCNNGAGESSGEYLYFLNNDTKVCPGWLEALLRTFNDFPGAGLIGSMLLYPDGVLQEAGGIVWKDGSAWNYGKYQDASLPKYNYAREVDYCSGASIMIPRFLFDQLSGFDQYFNPAYCEDCDIALKIRNLGYRVIYQPLSKVIHFEGITSGTDVLSGVKSYQIQNTKKLYQRWKHILDNYQPNGENLDCATDRRATRRVLVLDHCTPTPDQDAGSVIALNLMLLLREMDFQVTFIPEDNLLYMPDYTVDLQRVGIEALYYPYITSVEQHLQEAGNRYDLVFFIRPTVVQREIHLVRKYCSRAKLLYETCDMHHLRMFREAKLFNDPEKFQLAEDMKKLEMLSIQAVDATILRSTVELELLRPELPNSCLRVFPLIMNSYDSPDNFGDRKDIIFVGGYQHTPNIDAVKYFVESIMPLIRPLLPGISFCAVGSNPPPDILQLNCKDVKIVGYVKDIQTYFNSFRVSVVPLRYGAGIKGKIGTAMSAGLPVVATNLAVEGMGLTHNHNIIVADSPEILANEVFNLYTDIDLWKKIRSNGYEFSRLEWGPEASYNTLKNILSDIDLNVDSYRYPLSLCK